MFSDKIETQWVQITPGLKGFLALPSGGGPRPAVIVYYEIFGLNAHIQDVARKVAGAGYVALVPDVMAGRVFDYSDVSGALPAARSVTDPQFVAHARDSVEFLQHHPAVLPGHTGVVGFCIGGRWAFLVATELGEKIQAVAAFYGGGIDSKAPRYAALPSLLTKVAGIHAPVLLHYGALDQAILPEEIGRITTALAAANKRFDVQVFADTGHAFASDRREHFKAVAAAEAWELTWAHFARYLHPKSKG